MGLAPSELENITPYQFNLLREGYTQDQKFQWERVRYVAYWNYVMAGKSAKDVMSIEEFMPLDEKDLQRTPPEKLAPKYTKKQKEILDSMFNPGS